MVFPNKLNLCCLLSYLSVDVSLFLCLSISVSLHIVSVYVYAFFGRSEFSCFFECESVARPLSASLSLFQYFPIVPFLTLFLSPCLEPLSPPLPSAFLSNWPQLITKVYSYYWLYLPARATCSPLLIFKSKLMEMLSISLPLKLPRWSCILFSSPSDWFIFQFCRSLPWKEKKISFPPSFYCISEMGWPRQCRGMEVGGAGERAARFWVGDAPVLCHQRFSGLNLFYQSQNLLWV